MGTVHGVYLKYVGISALSYAGYSYLLGNDESGGDRPSLEGLIATGDMWKIGPALYMGYSTLLNGFIAVLFKLEMGMGIIGKDPKSGNIPLWSYIVFAPFHLPTILYTHVHTLHGTYTAPAVKENEKPKKEHVPVASLVQPGWYVGGCYAHQLDKDWAAVIDLTVEFPESCINRTKEYLSRPTWDGVPCTPEQLEEAATFAVNARKTHGGDVLVHCAHGRGRSTTVMCACLVKEGLFKTWEEAFEEGIKPGRPVCKLNKRMRQNLADWQAQYVDKENNKKGR